MLLRLRTLARFFPLLWLGVSAYGQSSLATVTGIVTDTAQAVIPGVAVSVRNVETNNTRQVLTTHTGDFTITNLSPGMYELKAEMQGFRAYRKAGIVLEVGQVLRNDIELHVGTVNESVTVMAEITTINTESGTLKGDVIAHEEIQDLPLEGRDFFDLALLVPGVYPRAQGGQGSGLTVNGARADNTNYYVDGFNNRNPRGAAPQIRPNIDALQEFRMETSGFSAEYGRMAGGIMNMALRSGTNRLRGTLFEYLRNEILDGRGFFDRELPKLRRNQFGATLSGPVVVPKLYGGGSRTFFLFSWEGYRQVLGQTRLARVPTLAERRGDFSSSVDFQDRPVLLRDPEASGSCTEAVRTACFPGNQIPAARFDPIAMKLLPYYPLPNLARLGFNYLTVANDTDVWDSFLGKVDHRFSEKNSVGLRYQKRFARNSGPFSGSDLGTFGIKQWDDRSLLGLDYTRVFSPAFLMEVRGGYSRNATRERSVWAGRNVAAELGIQGTTSDPELIGFPRFTVLNHAPLGDAAGQPLDYHVTDIQGSTRFTWVRSKHVLKWGLDVSRVRFNQPFNNNVRGTFAFQDRWTNHPISDLLLGMMQSTSRRIGTTRTYVRSNSYGAFFNDDFKVARSLTLNLGLRYEVDMPPVDRYDRMANFIPGLDKIILASDRNIPNLQQLLEEATFTLNGVRQSLADRVGLAKDLGLPRSLVLRDYTNFAPRFGFAWRPFGGQRSVLRGGYGIFYSGHLLNPVRASLTEVYPFAVSQSFSRQANRRDLVTLSNPFPDVRESLTGITNSSGYDVHAPTGYLQSYNLTVERDLGRGMALEAAYVGSKGTHLGRRYDVNQPVRSRELFDSGAGFPRPITVLNTINYYSFGSNSIYSAGQISLRKRSRGGLFYRVNYTYSKSIDDASQISGNSDGGVAGAQNARDLKSERGRSDWDRRHVLTSAFTWPLPVGRGKTFLSGARGWSNTLLSGWQLSGTVSLYTGQPFTVVTANTDPNLGESQRPNRIGTGRQPDLPGAGQRGADYPWFRLTDFERVPRCETTPVRQCGVSQYGFEAFRFGNSGRNILDGPGLAVVNFSLMKNFRMRERRNLQFRWEAFNAINHPNFLLPNRTFDAPRTGGIITRVVESGRGGPRVMQVALKYEF